MDELVRRLRDFERELRQEAYRSWPEISQQLTPKADDLRKAADTITLLRTALEGLVEAASDVYHDNLEPTEYAAAALAAARAALREVGRG